MYILVIRFSNITLEFELNSKELNNFIAWFDHHNSKMYNMKYYDNHYKIVRDKIECIRYVEKKEGDTSD